VKPVCWLLQVPQCWPWHTRSYSPSQGWKVPGDASVFSTSLYTPHLPMQVFISCSYFSLQWVGRIGRYSWWLEEERSLWINLAILILH